MKVIHTLVALAFVAMITSCKKDHMNTNPDPDPLPPEPTQKILLKDIILSNLPSPYYHFEYGPDSLAVKAYFDSGLTMYDILYSGGRISEMRDNIIVNHDTLRYFYDNGGKVTAVHFINQRNVLYRHVTFTYSGRQVTKIEWDRKQDNGSFLIDRSVTFTYNPDGNLKEMNEHRPAISAGSSEENYTLHYDEYDDKINVDDFTIIHDGIHDHLLVLPTLHLMKNNPKKEILTGTMSDYTATYTYTYNTNNTPVLKTGDLVFNVGSQAGQHFAIRTDYTYY